MRAVAEARTERARPRGRRTGHKVDGNGHFFWVTDPSGRIASKAFATFREAQTKAEKLDEEADREARFGKARRRPCMCCGREFQSDGIHNRLCGYCARVDHAPAVW
jgi:hypothetical protein